MPLTTWYFNISASSFVSFFSAATDVFNLLKAVLDGAKIVNGPVTNSLEFSYKKTRRENKIYSQIWIYKRGTEWNLTICPFWALLLYIQIQIICIVQKTKIYFYRCPILHVWLYYNFVMIRTSASVFTFPVEVLTDSDISRPSGSYSYISYFLPRQTDEWINEWVLYLL